MTMPAAQRPETLSLRVMSAFAPIIPLGFALLAAFRRTLDAKRRARLKRVPAARRAGGQPGAGVETEALALKKELIGE